MLKPVVIGETSWDRVEHGALRNVFQIVAEFRDVSILDKGV